MALTLRAATAADVPLLAELIRALATYEREPEAAQLTEDTLLRDGFGPDPAFRALVAEWDGAGCGMALYFPIYSTWQGRSLYLEDIFVRPQFRGRGIGRALLEKVAAEAVEQGCARLDWSVLNWNQPAIGFYESLGALRMGEWDRMRLTGEALLAVGGAKTRAACV